MIVWLNHQTVLCFSATGMTDKDFETPIVGVISTWAENTPCNIHLHDFGKLAKEGVKSAGAWPVQFGTITVADGIAMGTPGMRFSLTSRDIIADSIEAAMGGHNVGCLCCYWWL